MGLTVIPIFWNWEKGFKKSKTQTVQLSEKGNSQIYSFDGIKKNNGKLRNLKKLYPRSIENKVVGC